jgi:hypothetical protein
MEVSMLKMMDNMQKQMIKHHSKTLKKKYRNAKKN